MATSDAASAALTAAAHSISSLLGPERRLKYVEDAAVTDSALRVLSALSIDHPSIVLLIEACEGLEAAHGCGAAALTCLTADLAAAVAMRCPRGFELRAVLCGVRAAVQRACGVLDALASSLPQPLRFERTSCDAEASRLCDALAHGRPFEMALAQRCACLLGPPPWRLRQCVQVQCIGGVPATRSAVWPGILVPLDRRQSTTAQSVMSAAWAPSPVGGSGRGGRGVRSFCVYAVLLHADLAADSDGGLRRSGEMAADVAVRAPASRSHDGKLVVAINTPEDATDALARSLRAAGVRLVLVCGGSEARLTARLADFDVLVVNVEPASFYAFCDGARVAPLRDVRALWALAEPAHARRRLRVRGCLLHGGIGGASADGRGMQRPSNVYLHVRAVAPSVGAASAASGVVVLISCGLSDSAAGVTAAHVRRCLYRLQGALADGRTVAGGGAAEMACAAVLEEDAARHVAAAHSAPSPLEPLAATPCMPSASALERSRQERRAAVNAEGMALVGTALRALICRRAHNTGASTAEAEAGVAASIERWRQVGGVDAMRALAAHDEQTVPWHGAAWGPLCAWVGVADAYGSREGVGERPPPRDLLSAKGAVLRASVDVLEQVLLPDTVVSSAPE